ncbi:hypothetical protein [Thalassococcus lentus]|uniref:Uncharacterized protein n=1 Tax=Thalassococcus lentus TaxID=1210524 RepID=A0ABT4XQ10_9RHOB|nr:hypothetical protein [Thalassococcus lentus]MDA7424039.1 hypothetical protein [Thalassococcus lentus]
MISTLPTPVAAITFSVLFSGAAMANCTWSIGQPAITQTSKSVPVSFDVSSCPERETGAQAHVLVCASRTNSANVTAECLWGTSTTQTTSTQTSGSVVIGGMNPPDLYYVYVLYKWIYQQPLNGGTVKYRPVRTQGAPIPQVMTRPRGILKSAPKQRLQPGRNN